MIDLVYFDHSWGKRFEISVVIEHNLVLVLDIGGQVGGYLTLETGE
jgi:hypothetical protein